MSILAKYGYGWVEGGDSSNLKTEKDKDNLDDCKISDEAKDQSYECIGLLTADNANDGGSDFTLHIEGWEGGQNVRSKNLVLRFCRLFVFVFVFALKTADRTPFGS